MFRHDGVRTSHWTIKSHDVLSVNSANGLLIWEFSSKVFAGVFSCFILLTVHAPVCLQSRDKCHGHEFNESPEAWFQLDHLKFMPSTFSRCLWLQRNTKAKSRTERIIVIIIQVCR